MKFYSSLPGSTRQSIKTMIFQSLWIDARVKPVHDGQVADIMRPPPPIPARGEESKEVL
ncbi:hypothetical protein [Nitrobacter sp.]|uniref:hypothetical protein n=1 Tax=Nitrobacter sp. TaxID=29420 RepID=UPI00399D728F